MPATIDISELRIGYVLGAPIFDDKNVKLLGQGVTIAEKFIHQLRRRGIRSVQVTEDDLARLRGWTLSVDAPSDVAAKRPSAASKEPDSRIDQGRFRRYLSTISDIGRQSRTNVGPLKMIRESAQLAAAALRAEHYGFGLIFPNTEGVSFFVGARNPGTADQKLQRYHLDLCGNTSLMAASMASDSPLFVQNLADDKRFSDEILLALDIESVAAVPLHRGMIRSGTMAVFYDETRKLDDHDLSFFETVANIVTVPTNIDASEWTAESNGVDELPISRRYDYRCWQSIAPLDGEQAPVRTAYEEVLCRDISTGGFSFYYPRRPEFSQLAVALGQPPNLKQMKATVVSCCGTEVEGEPCALVGCRFTGPLATC
jgi:hypothetical protein